MLIYAIGPLDGSFKVGVSANPERRCSALSNASLRRLRVAHAAPVLPGDARRIEGHAHWLLRGSHNQGEWFKAPLDVVRQAIDQAVAWHPAEVIDALWRGLSEREGPVAVHYAALLTYLYGRADSLFDFDQRPLFLRFHADDPAHRADALAALHQHLAGAAPFPSIDLPS